MRGLDLYRVTLAYLGIIFVLCALVLYVPFGALWSDGTPTVAQQVATVPPQQKGIAQQDAPDDTAELVARMVARDFTADFGEGDVAWLPDEALSLDAERVASGLDVAYTVGPDDSLGSLALRFYGDSALSTVIFEANRGLMGSPDQLRVGQVVIIPGRS